MYLLELSALNFKNHEETNLVFSDNINCFVGENGSGKTNLLDAIHYLSFTKSYFHNQDSLNIKHDELFLSVKGSFVKENNKDLVHCSIKKGSGKVVKRNGKRYNRLSNHIGLYPLVMISPTDTNLILEGSEVRRKYIDSVICQFDRLYLDSLISYNKLLLQRNAVLKHIYRGVSSIDDLDLYDEQLEPLASQIFEKRQVFLKSLIPVVKSYYHKISNNKEKINLSYKSQLFDGDYKMLMQDSRERDCFLKYSSLGIHKDDFMFELDNHPIKKIGSQGQQKTFLMALKLAQFDFMKAVLGYKPMLLLDDIFDKLDHNRVEQIVKLVDNSHFGQIFITDTNAERSIDIFTKTEAEFKLFYVKNGEIEKKK